MSFYHLIAFVAIILQLTVIDCGNSTTDVSVKTSTTGVTVTELGLTMLGVILIESCSVNKPRVRDVVWRSPAAETIAVGLGVIIEPVG